MKPVCYDAHKLQGLLGPQEMTSYDAGIGQTLTWASDENVTDDRRNRPSRVGIDCGTYRLVERQTMDNTRWNRDQTRRVKGRRCSVDLTWLAISQAGVNDFISRQYLHRSADSHRARGITPLRGR
jgi:hypothetical protein